MKEEQLFDFLNVQLSSCYEIEELRSITRIIWNALTKYDEVAIKDNKGQQSGIPLDQVIDRLLKLEPLDYILGHKPFMDLDILLNKYTLIPRPETEELVNVAKTQLTHIRNENLQILDVGTGSGCVALAMKYYFPQSDVIGIDISEEALQLARINAEYNGLIVEFANLDFLDESRWEEWGFFFDVIISNPPYISRHEKKYMDASVLRYEPDIALFPAHDDPLIFYKKIALFGKKYLKTEGSVFVECNSMKSVEIQEVFSDYSDSEIIDDINGMPRIIMASNPQTI